MIIETKGTRLVSISQDSIELLCELHRKRGIKETLKILGISEESYLKLVNCKAVQRRVAERALSAAGAPKL